jgi:hypothetical protein
MPTPRLHSVWGVFNVLEGNYEIFFFASNNAKLYVINFFS